MALRVCVLNSSYEHSSSPFKDHDPYMDPRPYLDAPADRCLVEKAIAGRQIQELAQRGFDVFVNLCDGSWDEDRAGIEVVHALERLGQAFTGSDSTGYDPSREEMKLAAYYAEVDTPRHVLARGENEAERALGELRFPMIVKHPNSYGSIGLTRASRVATPDDLRREMARMIAEFGGALVEEFIEGREYTTLVADGAGDPRVFVPIEFRFPAGETFKHFDLKWINFTAMRPTPVDDDALAERLCEVSRRFYAAMGCVGYGRCDLRVDAEGRVYVLEVNPNPAVFYPPGYFGECDEILTHDAAGYRGFLAHILENALRRQRARRRPFAVRRDGRGGMGLFATVDLAVGDLVDTYENRPHVLVSRGYVDRAFGSLARRWFVQYAYPLSDGVHVVWERCPGTWKPINHSCDPNTWLDGLDLVARRAVRRGEEFTMDYATFCGPGMAPFECRCGAALCRGTIRGSDHVAPFVAERYGDHVSDYVRSKRRQQRPRAPYPDAPKPARLTVVPPSGEGKSALSRLSGGCDAGCEAERRRRRRGREACRRARRSDAKLDAIAAKLKA